MAHTPDNPVVWTELPVTDLAAAVAFYNAVLGTRMEIDTSGPNPMAVIPGAKDAVAGHLYPGTPAPKGSGPTVHLAVPDTVEAAMERCRAAGGEVDGTIIPLPMGRFAYAKDPDGNSIGLFEHA
jgi:hypothetical protein